MNSYNNPNKTLQFKLMDVVSGNIKIKPTLRSLSIRNGAIAKLSSDEKSTLLFSIVDQSSNAVVITDDRKRIAYVNKKFEEVSGYSSQEVLGKDPKILQSGKTSASTYQDMRRTLAAKNQWRGEFINRHPSGKEYIEEAVISPITNERGDIVCYLAEKKDITEQKLAQENIHKLTHFDSLTGIPNRACFIEEVNRLTKSERIADNRFSILFIDLNRFKELNDTYGHIVGDKALQHVAARIQQMIPDGDLIARLGGDEFVVVHKHSTDASTAELADKISNSFSSPFIIGNHKKYLGVSIGSATWPIDGLSIKKILIRADMAMYNGKQNSSHYTAYSDSLGAKYGRDFHLARRLDMAIQNNSLYLLYQPKIDLQTGLVRGVEALLRWNDPELGAISPGEFIPVAEKYKKMTVIGNWVIKQACRQLNRWKSEGKQFVGKMAVNLSVQQIEDKDFYQNTLQILYGENIEPSMIELEVTESLLISDPNRALALFRKLKSAGFSIAIDDFGTGYSSLAYLSKFNADVLKIDKSFIDNITTNIHDKSIVKSIIEMGHNLDLSVIAEGVETRAQLNQLKSLGCDEAQGYLFEKPQPAHMLFPLQEYPFCIKSVPDKGMHTHSHAHQEEPVCQVGIPTKTLGTRHDCNKGESYRFTNYI